MAHGDLAQIAAVVGASGSVLALVTPRRAVLLAGLALIAAAEVGLAVALVPSHDLEQLSSTLRVAALVAAAIGVVAAAALFVRWPALTPLALLIAAPFRLSVHLGSQHAFLLIPLYAVLAAATLALVCRAVRGDPLPVLPRVLAVPVAAFIAFDALSLLWAQDLEQGSIELVFFIFPFAVLVAVVARTPYQNWLPRALTTALIGLAVVFAGIGIYQAWTHTLIFAQDLRVANAYTTYFRVTSLFKDPSIYGRHLVLAVSLLVVLLWLRRLRVLAVAALVAFLFVGLYFSYSQSSMAVLFVAVLLITLVLADRRSRNVVVVAGLVAALAGGAVAATTAKGTSLRKATSGRTRLVGVTSVVIQNHPFVGVGVGSQPLASRQEAKTRIGARRNASHTTPLTVFAELGVVGFLLYGAFLAGAAVLLRNAVRRRREVGLGLAASFLVLFLHSLFYSGFFEDPMTWGVLAFAATALAVSVPPRGDRAAPEAPEEPEGDGLGGAAEVDGSRAGAPAPADHAAGQPGGRLRAH
jgi:hypothetical protein